MAKNKTQKNDENLISLLELIRFGNDRPKTDRNINAAEVSAQLKSFFDQMPGGFFIYRADGDEQVLYANQAVLRIFGCQTEDQFAKLTGNSFKGIVHPDDLDEVEDSIVEQISHSQYDLDYVEYRIVRRDGSVRWVEDYGHFVNSPDHGGIFYVFISDATEKVMRHMMEKASLIEQRNEQHRKIETLREEYAVERQLVNEEQLRRLEVIEGLSVNYDSILFIDLDLNSVIAYRLSSRTKELFNGLNCPREYTSFAEEYVNMWVHPDDKDAVLRFFSKQFIMQQLAVHKSVFQSYRCVENSGVLHLQLRIVNVGDNDAQIVLGFQNIDDEIREAVHRRHILEDALENARQSAKVKDLFLANMSHDMRTPLNAIFGYIQLAQNNIKNSKAVAEYLDKISEASNKIYGSVLEALEVTDREAQKNRINEAPCDLYDMMEEVHEYCKKRALRKKIAVTSNVDITNSKVIADVEKLKSVLQHLAENALRYSPRESRVEFSLVQGEALPNGCTNYSFAVSDSGASYSEEMISNMFNSDGQEYLATAVGNVSTGLAPIIAKYYTERMGGQISVESGEDYGNKVVVTLGLRVIQGDNTSSQNILDEIRSHKILVVDDNEINLEIETELLEVEGFATDRAENGKIALEKLQNSAEDCYSAVLMDIQMPVMDGLEAARAIRSLRNPRLARIPIIAVSANSLEGDRRKTMRAGMDTHLPKPLDVPKLLEILSKIIASRKCE